MIDCPTFEEFYQAVHGRPPLPWQRRLAHAAATAWPREIGVATGLGKTSALDIAVWTLAAQADRPPQTRTAPTRIWYVVNRRLLVDAASDHAARLADRLFSDADPVIRAVADRLRSIEGGVTNRPLTVSRLRGGTSLDARPTHPAQPAIICATVPMFASRLLFNAYGTGRGVRPIEAALAGADSLVLLDEAHLSPTLQSLVDDLARCDANRNGVLRWAGQVTPGPGPELLLGRWRRYPTMVSLTATGGEATNRFDLDDQDLAHPIVRKRLDAKKPTSVVTTTTKLLVTQLADATLDVVRSAPEPCTCLVFVNRPDTARAVAAGLRSKLERLDVELVVLTGRLRGFDAERVRQRLIDPLDGLPSDRSQSRARTLVVVATQTLEVGADLDADHLITESAGVRALTQRFGRLNRLGERPWATGLVVHPTDAKPGLYGDEPNAVAARLQKAEGFEGVVDLCPRMIASVLGKPSDTPPESPTLLTTHLWEWSKTSAEVPGAPPIEPFYEGITDPDIGVSVAWRTHIGYQGEALYPTPNHLEWVEVPVWEAAKLVERSEALRVHPGDGTLCAVDAAHLQPGSRIVVAAASGGYTTDGFDAEADSTVNDLSIELEGALRLESADVAAFLGRELEPIEQQLLAELHIEDGEARSDRSMLDTVWGLVASRITAEQSTASVIAIDRVGIDDTPWLRWRVEQSPARTAVDALDEVSLAPLATLHDHLRNVGATAERIALSLGLPDHLVAALRDAARFHDLGKADSRFQRWLSAPVDQLMAKSDVSPGRWRQTRVAAGWPAGARHELLSLQILNAAVDVGLHLNEQQLVQHLVVSHHGHGRPAVPVSRTQHACVRQHVALEGVEVDVNLDPSAADWTQPDRFRDLSEHYGFWGLALLESIVRQADHIVSAVTEVQ